MVRQVPQPNLSVRSPSCCHFAIGRYRSLPDPTALRLGSRIKRGRGQFLSARQEAQGNYFAALMKWLSNSFKLAPSRNRISPLPSAVANNLPRVGFGSQQDDIPPCRGEKISLDGHE